MERLRLFGSVKFFEKILVIGFSMENDLYHNVSDGGSNIC